MQILSIIVNVLFKNNTLGTLWYRLRYEWTKIVLFHDGPQQQTKLK